MIFSNDDFFMRELTKYNESHSLRTMQDIFKEHEKYLWLLFLAKTIKHYEVEKYLPAKA